MAKEDFSAANAVWVEVKPPPWWLLLIEGILLAIIGVALLVSPYRTFVSIVWVLGIYWVLRGALNLVSLLWDRRLWGWKVLAGVLGLVAGWIVWQNPITSAIVVSQVTVWMIAFIAFYFGILDLIRAIRGAGWMTGILGVISIVLGILLLTNAFAASASLPLVIGLFAILGGVLLIFSSFRVRSLHHAVSELKEQAAN
jgi:uncharacterized membrane protein HdeD (DUF308 family)